MNPEPRSLPRQSDMEWRQHGDHTWWLVFREAPESLRSDDGALWPPTMAITWAGPGACCHLHDYSNGYMPGEPNQNEDDVDYLHICNVDDLIGELEAFKAASGWQPAERETSDAT